VQDKKDDLDLGGVTIGLHDGPFRGESHTRGVWGGFLDLVAENAAQANWRMPLRGVGHELLHQIGFAHAGRDCDDVEGAEAWPPDDVGAIQGWGIKSAQPGGGGFHHVFGAPSPGQFEPAGAPTQYFDLMSYCGVAETTWISVRNWTRLLVEDW
jgi:hypothetical protein